MADKRRPNDFTRRSRALLLSSPQRGSPVRNLRLGRFSGSVPDLRNRDGISDGNMPAMRDLEGLRDGYGLRDSNEPNGLPKPSPTARYLDLSGLRGYRENDALNGRNERPRETECCRVMPYARRANCPVIFHPDFDVRRSRQLVEMENVRVSVSFVNNVRCVKAISWFITPLVTAVNRAVF